MQDQDNTKSQTLRAVLGLRGLIIDGLLAPGARVAEPMIVERFGVSRTPARAALAQLAEEGLLERRETSGFAVKAYSAQDIFQAIEIRGTLEGLAARYAAEGTVPKALLMRMRACVAELDDVVGNLSADVDQSDYVRLNDDFHRLLIEASGSDMVARSLDRIKALPFAAPNAFVQSLALDHASVKKVLIMAQEQHRAIVEAIAQGHGARAQSLAHEHSFCAARYLELLQARDHAIPWVAAGTDG